MRAMQVVFQHNPHTLYISYIHSSPYFWCLQELIAELQEPAGFGKRGEVWLICQMALLALIVFCPLTPLKGLVDLAGTLSLTAGFVFMWVTYNRPPVIHQCMFAVRMCLGCNQM